MGDLLAPQASSPRAAEQPTRNPAAGAGPDALRLESSEIPSFSFGFAKNFEDLFDWGRALGKGGSGVVSVVKERSSGIEYACKSIPKLVHGQDLAKNQRRWAAIQKEVEALRRLRGALNIVELHQVFEDDDFVHIGKRRLISIGRSTACKSAA